MATDTEQQQVKLEVGDWVTYIGSDILAQEHIGKCPRRVIELIGKHSMRVDGADPHIAGDNRWSVGMPWRHATPSEIAAVPICEGDVITCGFNEADYNYIVATAPAVDTAKSEDGSKETHWRHGTPGQYRDSTGHQKPAPAVVELDASDVLEVQVPTDDPLEQSGTDKLELDPEKVEAQFAAVSRRIDALDHEDVAESLNLHERLLALEAKPPEPEQPQIPWLYNVFSGNRYIDLKDTASPDVNGRAWVSNGKKCIWHYPAALTSIKPEPEPAIDNSNTLSEFRKRADSERTDAYWNGRKDGFESCKAITKRYIPIYAILLTATGVLGTLATLTCLGMF